MECKDFRILQFQIKNNSNFYSECLEFNEFECKETSEKSLDYLITRLRFSLSGLSDSRIYDPKEESSKKIREIYDSAIYSESIRIIVPRPVFIGGEFKAKFDIHKVNRPLDISYAIM